MGNLVWFCLWKLWYDKGVAIFASMRMVEITDIAILMAAFKFLFGDGISMWWVVLVGVVYYPTRTLIYFFLGLLWEHENGWAIHTDVNRNRVEPGRVIIVNTDDLAEKIVQKLKEG